MKTKLIILLLLCSIAGACQVLRPPIDTKELRTKELEWRGLEMGRDSLPYWWPINSNSFTLSRPDESFSQTYSFPSDSVFWPEYNIWVCSGCQIYYNDSIFYVRRDPECGNCWQYSYNRVSWRELFCESSLDRTIDIVPSSRHILKDGDYIEWVGEDSLDVGVTYLGFKRRAEYEGKTLRYQNDSVRWSMPDSIYINKIWRNPLDTVNVYDSIYFKNLNVWAHTLDTIDMFWVPTPFGISYKGKIVIDTTATENAIMSINSNDAFYGLLVEGLNDGIVARSTGSYTTGITGSATGYHSIGVSGWSDKYHGVAGYTDTGVGVYAGATTGWALRVSGNVKGGYILGCDSIGLKVEANGIGAHIQSIENLALKVTGSNNTFAPFYHSAIFEKGGVVIEDSLQVGTTGTTITRTGSMASMDFWAGTQAEWTANTPKNGIYPQASTTFWTIKD